MRLSYYNWLISFLDTDWEPFLFGERTAVFLDGDGLLVEDVPNMSHQECIMQKDERILQIKHNLSWLPRPNEVRTVLSSQLPPAERIATALVLAFDRDRMHAFALCLDLLTQPRKKIRGHLAKWASRHKAQVHAITVGREHAVTGQRFGTFSHTTKPPALAFITACLSSNSV